MSIIYNYYKYNTPLRQPQYLHDTMDTPPDTITYTYIKMVYYVYLYSYYYYYVMLYREQKLKTEELNNIRSLNCSLLKVTMFHITGIVDIG